MNATESPTEAHPTAYTFGDILIERRNLRVFKEGQLRSIEPRAFDLLIFLIEHRGRVVDKQELFERIWKQSFVTDSALAQEIKNIRHVIGDDARSPHYIETVPKHGYRFIAEVGRVTPCPAESSGNGRTVPPASAIAVLPFVNLSGDPDNDYFCDGLSEELIDRLTKLKRLRVVAHTSSFSFKGKDVDVREIGRKLNAGTILEGSVRRHGDRLRISVQIVDASNGYHISSESYDRRWEDLFAMQDEIALAILDKLKVELFPDDMKALVTRYTKNLEAYHLYLKGRYFWNQRLVPGALQKAIDYFQRAIKADSRYALAYTGLADAYTVIGFFALKFPHEVMPLAKAMVEKAFEIEPDLPEAHNSLGSIYQFYECDCASAEREFKRALELRPDYALAHQWYSYHLMIEGRMDEALAQVRLALELDPISPNVNAAVGQVLCYAHKYEAAVEQLQKTVELEPRFGLAYFYLGETWTMQGKYHQALAAMQKALEVSGDYPWAACYIGAIHAFLGNRKKAEEILHKCELQGRTPVVVAFVHLALGEIDQAFEWLEKAYEQCEFLFTWVTVIPEFDPMRSDPRFQDLLRRAVLAS